MSYGAEVVFNHSHYKIPHREYTLTKRSLELSCIFYKNYDCEAISGRILKILSDMKTSEQELVTDSKYNQAEVVFNHSSCFQILWAKSTTDGSSLPCCCF